MKGRRESNINVWFPFVCSQKSNCAASLFPKQIYNVLYPNSYTHISVRDLYIFRIGLSILLHAKYVDRSWDYIYCSPTHECRPRNSFSLNNKLYFRYSAAAEPLPATALTISTTRVGAWQPSQPVGLYSHQHRWYGAWLAKPPISTLLFSSLWASLRNLTGSLMYLFSCARRNQNRIFDIPPPLRCTTPFVHRGVSIVSKAKSSQHRDREPNYHFLALCK